MAALELKFLGDLAVSRDGVALELPPSRKTRALLAYLALNRRAFRREHLCELLWEVSDDPRGSLRWSLSKLRRLVDEESHSRIVADRNTVALDASGIAIDLVTHLAAAAGDLESCPVRTLEAAAARYRGHFLEDLALPRFYDFDAWCIAQREAALAAQIRILTALTRRLADQAQQALPHARALVSIAPYDEPARATLIRLLVALGRDDQAEQQYAAGMRMLQEAGTSSSGALYRAWRGAPGARQPVRAAGTPAPPAIQPTRPAPTPIPSAALIGRDAEIVQISHAIDQTVANGSARLLLLSGEPGIGKSRLLEAATERARQAGVLLLAADAHESESIRPFALWIDAIRALDPAAAAAIFGNDQTNRERLFSGLSDLVAERSGTQPIVLMFDDLQWCDESSAAALHYVARTNAQRPVLGILAARADELRDNAPLQRALRGLRVAGLLEDIQLGPLAADAVRELIAARAPTADSDQLSRACSGNPLLAIELARAEVAGDSGHSLADLVQERLARFDVESSDVLRWAAVLAPRIDTATLAAVTGLDWNRIGEVLEAAALQSMLQPSGRGFRFSHDLIARSIYAGISPARRRTMHRRIAEQLERETALDLGHAADLAHHAVQSGDIALAARAMISAGRLCLRFFANADALALARKGLMWVEQLPDAQRVCLTLELHEILLAAAPLQDREAAAAQYAALAERALDHGARAHAQRGYYMASYVRWMHGHWAAAREEILQAERVTRGGSDEEHIAGMAEAAKCLAMLERDLPMADALLMEAQALATRRRVTHYAIPAALGMLRFHQNRCDEAADLFKEARTLAKSSGDRLNEFQALEYSVMLEFERERYAAARTHCAALTELGDKLREGSEGPFARTLDALCHYALTGDSSALDAPLEALRIADAKHRLAYALTRAALLDIGRRCSESAIARASEALGYAETLDRATEIALAHAALARACDALDDAPGCAAHTAALARLDAAPVAQWARARAASVAPRAASHRAGVHDAERARRP